MSFRRLVFGLIVTAGLWLLIACQGTSTAPTAAGTATPTARVTTSPAGEPTATPTAAPRLAPGPTAVPTAKATPELAAAKNDVPEPGDVHQAPPPVQPATSERAGESKAPAAQPANSKPNSQLKARSPVFYDQNGLTLEYYWPLDNQGFLSASETEILAYNKSDEEIEFKSPKITFMENGSQRAQISGTWEKFPSRDSWDRIEYISIPPSPYQGDALLVDPGEKAKIHWHMESVTSADTDQSVVLDLTVTTGAGTELITQSILRNPQNHGIGVSTAPEPAQPEPQETQHSTTNDVPAGTSKNTSDVRWSFDGTRWSPNGTPPDCSEPFVLQTPVDMNLVTAALWPGQVRGAYVAHGGFRFDANGGNDVTVRSPIGSHLVQAARYLEGADDQYLLFFSVPCGFFYRFDHVRVLSPKLADAVKDFPAPTSGDSRTTYINPPVSLEQGEIVGTSVGIFPSNVFVDFGLYDVRTPNNATPNPAWADLYAADKEFGHYGVCFFDYLPSKDGDTMRSLPTGKEGQTSDYCE